MSSSRESGESDESSSESGDETVEFDSLEILKLLIALNRASAEVIVRFSVTSYANHQYVLKWLTDELHVLSDRNNSWMLLMFENVLWAGDEKAKWLAKLAINNFGAAGIKAPIEEKVFDRIVRATRQSGYSNHQHELSACNNAAMFGNHQSLSCLLKYQFPLPSVVHKVKEKFCFYFERRNLVKAEAYLRTLGVITEYALRSTLQTVRDEIKEFEFVIHNGGGVMCDGRKMPAHAAAAFNMIVAVLEQGESLVENYAVLRQQICDKLNGVDDEKSRSYVALTLFALNLLPATARDSSTTIFYNEMMSILDDGAADLREYQRLSRLFSEQSLATNPTMSQ